MLAPSIPEDALRGSRYLQPHEGCTLASFLWGVEGHCFLGCPVALAHPLFSTAPCGCPEVAEALLCLQGPHGIRGVGTVFLPKHSTSLSSLWAREISWGKWTPCSTLM